MKISPLAIGIALHYHCQGGDYRDGDFSAPAVSECLLDFRDAGLLEELVNQSQHYKGTDALSCYVNALCSVPLPVQQWAIPWHLIDQPST